MTIKHVDELVAQLKKNLDQRLLSVILYGSTVSGEQTKKFSNTNILLVLSDLGLFTLKILKPSIQSWVANGNPSPILFTPEQIRESKDVFPIELMDIRDSHQVLFGDDPFTNLMITPANLRHQLEFELRGKLIQLRQRYMAVDGNFSHMVELLSKSLTTVSVLLKAVLRLKGIDIPSKRSEVWEIVNQHVRIDVQMLEDIHQLRNKEKKINLSEAENMFDRLLTNMEDVAAYVNKEEK